MNSVSLKRQLLPWWYCMAANQRSASVCITWYSATKPHRFTKWSVCCWTWFEEHNTKSISVFVCVSVCQTILGSYWTTEKNMFLISIMGSGVNSLELPLACHVYQSLHKRESTTILFARCVMDNIKPWQQTQSSELLLFIIFMRCLESKKSPVSCYICSANQQEHLQYKLWMKGCHKLVYHYCSF